MKQRFKKATAGVIALVPREGPPVTSATVALFGPGAGVLQAAAAATLSTADTTISAAAALGANTITVASATGIAEGVELWVGTTGTDILELCRVRSVATLVVTLQAPLQYAHVSGSEVKGSRITYALTTTHTATASRNNRALWAYTVNGTSYEATQLFDIVESVFKLLITPSDLRKKIPHNLRYSAEDLSDLELIVEAENAIYTDLTRRDLRPDLIRDLDQFRVLGVLAAKVVLLDRVATNDPAMAQSLKLAQSAYDVELGKIMMGGLEWYDSDEDLAVSSTTDYAGNEIDSEQDQKVAPYIPIG